MKDLLDDIDRWQHAGKRVAVARVVDIEGSGPRDPGAAMAVNESARSSAASAGAASRVPSSAKRCRSSRARPSRGVITFGYSDDEAFAVGLTCGGTIRLFIEELDW